MTTQVKEVSRKVAENAKVAATEEQKMNGMKRRGFFGSLAATVAGAVGVSKFFPNLVSHQQVLKDEKPVVSIHPDAIARTDEGSRRHG